jgi:hypothetical protein
LNSCKLEHQLNKEKHNYNPKITARKKNPQNLSSKQNTKMGPVYKKATNFTFHRTKSISKNTMQCRRLRKYHNKIKLYKREREREHTMR